MRAAFARTALVVDEGPLASTIQARDLLRIDDALRIPRVVLVGNDKQLGAVDVGKPFAQLALNRKNALFAGHDEGAAAWGRIALLIKTAKLNGVNPRTWLMATLEAIAAGHPNSRFDELLPWNFDRPLS